MTDTQTTESAVTLDMTGLSLPVEVRSMAVTYS